MLKTYTINNVKTNTYLGTFEANSQSGALDEFAKTHGYANYEDFCEVEDLREPVGEDDIQVDLQLRDRDGNYRFAKSSLIDWMGMIPSHILSAIATGQVNARLAAVDLLSMRGQCVETLTWLKFSEAEEVAIEWRKKVTA
jgi:hypothetical protein